ncbi:MAG: pyridoxamine 5'-phosphate oxidase [Chloroflexi bacterium]|nr:pyridoxamine 5'-phosphate oxidase [Chloroflexota bacterium]
MGNEVEQRTLAYLRSHQVITLATDGPEGLWAAAVFYVNEGFDLYFLSAGHTRHAQNIAASPRVAATIQGDYADWTAVQGIQLEGFAQRLQGETRQHAIALYRTKYAFLSLIPPAIQTALAQVYWYRLRPERLYFVDNSRGFGHRDLVFTVY